MKVLHVITGGWAFAVGAGICRGAVQGGGGRMAVLDQATICWKLGIPINLVPGNRGNIKITTPEDIIMLEALLADAKSKQKF